MNQQKKLAPAYRIETDRLIIRCYHPKDANLLATSIQESLEHLKPWMPWAHAEPELIETKIQRLRRFRAEFDLDQQYVYGIFNKSETKLMGGTGLHRRVGENAFEIGYWINSKEINQGFCTESSRALTKVGFELFPTERIEIHCDPQNKASASIPNKIGYVYDGTLRKRVYNENKDLKDCMIWSMFRKEYDNSDMKNLPIRAFNACGNQIL